MSSQPDIPPKRRYTPEEYLALERAADYRSEYLGGEIVAMTGASRYHNLITVNITTALSLQFADRPCEAYASDMRVKVSAANDYTYPDIVALCGEPRFEDRELDTLLNPTMLIEALSPSTQRYDRGDKFALYRRIPTLTDFLLVAQNEIKVEHHAKQNDFQWLLTEYAHREAVISLPTLGCTLRLSDIYKKITFAATPEIDS